MVRIRDLKGKKVLITGGSSGIGRSTAEMFSGKGAEVMITARDLTKLERTSKEVSGIIDHRSVDVSRWKDVSDLAKDLRDKGMIPDILINSAGIVHPGRLEDLEHSQIKAILDVDLLGTINVCKAFSGMMKGPAYVINISSVAGFIGIYGYTAYSAAKFGVWGFSQALRMELEPRDIGVGVVFPPDTRTPQLEFENRTKPKELKEISGAIDPILPEKVASSIIKGINKGDFMIFPDRSSLSTYHANRLAGPAVRSWMDRKVNSAGNE